MFLSLIERWGDKRGRADEALVLEIFYLWSEFQVFGAAFMSRL